MLPLAAAGLVIFALNDPVSKIDIRLANAAASN
jgi:hypothetical protein